MSSLRHQLGYTKPAQPIGKPVVEKSYHDFIKTLPCLVTGGEGVDPAHLNTGNGLYGHMGRGKGQKSSSRWVLPLCREQHEAQHAARKMHGDRTGELGYWKAVQINPYLIALILYGLWSEMKDNAYEPACKVVRMARQISASA